MFVHTSMLVVAWGDCDPAGIVFYPRFFEMFDEATAAMMQAATGRSRFELIAAEDILGWPMVDTRAVFHAPVRFDDQVRIETSVTRLGRSSFDLTHEMWRRETHCVSATETRVWSANGDGVRNPVPRQLPDTIRAQLSIAMEKD